MDRKKFLSSIGTTAACICVGGMAACVKTSEPPAGSSRRRVAPAVVIRHAGFSVDYDFGLGHFRCPGHFSEFALNGSRISGAAPRGLDKLTFTVVGDKLIIET